MHRLGEIYVEYPRSSLTYSHASRAAKARSGRLIEAMDVFDYGSSPLSPSRARSIGRATNVSDRYFRPPSPHQDVNQLHPGRPSPEQHDRTRETFRAYPLHGENVVMNNENEGMHAS